MTGNAMLGGKLSLLSNTQTEMCIIVYVRVFRYIFAYTQNKNRLNYNISHVQCIYENFVPQT